MRYIKTYLFVLLSALTFTGPMKIYAQQADSTSVVLPLVSPDTAVANDTVGQTLATVIGRHEKPVPVSPYALPYSLNGNSYDWHRLWINTATLSGAFVGTLLVLECLPEDATAWNRAEIQDVPLFKRWNNHVIKEGPEWDHDKFYFNYIMHPYAGAAYFMGARSCGFNFWRSALYSAIISTVGWEFGIEAFMERPSIQDLFVTPVIGSCMGEGFYHVKRWLVDNDYCLFGSPVLGEILAILVDPLNEFTGLWLGNPARKIAHSRARERSKADITFAPMITPSYTGFSIVGRF